MIRHSCCVTGHREIAGEKLEQVKERLRAEVEKAIEDDFFLFYSGFAEGIDHIFAGIVAEQKKKNKKLRLFAMLPHPDRERELNTNEESRKLLAACDCVKVHSPDFKDDSNKIYMAEECYRCIAVYDGRPEGETAGVMEHARELERDLRIVAI